VPGEPEALLLSPAHEAAALLAHRELSSVDLVRALLARIGRLDPKLHAYLTLLPERALEEAARLDAERAAGRVRGPLHGIPVGIKDLIDVEGVVTSCGSRLLAAHVAAEDATVVRKLRAAGCIVVGKLHLTEFAMMGYPDGWPVPVNPWNAERSAMGSSSGSGVAVAAGLCFGALGTDTGGSIRGPCAANGIVGMKPTWGRVSRQRVFPLAPSLDHVGPMTRSVADAAAMLDALAGFDPGDPTSLRGAGPGCVAALGGGARGLRVGLDERYVGTHTSPETTRACLDAVEVLRRQGAEIVGVEVPPVDEIVEAWAPIAAAEALVAHATFWPARAEEYGASFRSVLAYGEKVTASDLVRAQQLRLEWSGRLRGLFETVDLLACPSGPVESVPAALMPPDVLFTTATAPFQRFTAPFDLSGSPTLSLPCGKSADGFLHSLQLVGRHGQEALLCRVGEAFERATEWHLLHPEL
jgi:amidase